MQYVKWQTEIADRQQDPQHSEEVRKVEEQGYIVITFDMQWTGLYTETGQPILQKIMGYGTNEQRQEVYGPDIVPSENQRKARKLRIKAQTEDLSNAELNELIRLGG